MVQVAGGDLVAGLTLWGVFVTQALAFSRLAHATATAGLVTAIAGSGMYALLGSSRRLSIGPAVGIAAIVGAVVAGVPAEHLSASLAILTLAAGAFLCLAGGLGISIIERLFPTPVLVGYLAGTGIAIVVGQGEEIIAGAPGSIAICATSIAAVVTLMRLLPRLPAAFTVLVTATLASVVFGLPDRGIAVIGSSVGRFATPALPEGFTWSDARDLVAPAAGLAIIVYVDTLATAALLAARTDAPVRPRREYIALGAVNLVAGMWGGFVGGARSSGEHTKLASLTAGVLLVITALGAVRVLAPMPLAALSGVVCVAATGLVDWRYLREMRRTSRADFWLALAAAAGVVIAGIAQGIAIGIVIAFADAFRRAMSPDRLLVTSRAGEHIYEPFCAKAVGRLPDLVVYRFGAALFFANAHVFVDDMRRIAAEAPASLRTVMVNADALGIPDLTARDALAASRSLLARKGIELLFGNVSAAQREAFCRAGLPVVEEAHFLAAVREIRTSRVQRTGSAPFSARDASARPRPTRSP